MNKSFCLILILYAVVTSSKKSGKFYVLTFENTWKPQCWALLATKLQNKVPPPHTHTHKKNHLHQSYVLGCCNLMQKKSMHWLKKYLKNLFLTHFGPTLAQKLKNKVIPKKSFVLMSPFWPKSPITRFFPKTGSFVTKWKKIEKILKSIFLKIEKLILGLF